MQGNCTEDTPPPVGAMSVVPPACVIQADGPVLALTRGGSRAASRKSHTLWLNQLHFFVAPGAAPAPSAAPDLQDTAAVPLAASPLAASPRGSPRSSLSDAGAVPRIRSGMRGSYASRVPRRLASAGSDVADAASSAVPIVDVAAKGSKVWLTGVVLQQRPPQQEQQDGPPEQGDQQQALRGINVHASSICCEGARQAAARLLARACC